MVRMAGWGLCVAFVAALAGCGETQLRLGYPGQYPPAYVAREVPSARLGLRAFPEWAKSRWLVVALPCPGDGREAPEERETPEEWAGRWGEALRKVSSSVRVVLLVHEDRLDELAALAARWGEDMDEADVLFALTGSPWLRDYGPIFARGRGGRLYALDPLRSDPRGPTEASWDEEIMPLRLVELLSLRGAELTLLPVPLFLDGGDFQTDGQGTAFTSRETVLKNGGDPETLGHLFARCFGCPRTVVLESLPGPVARHVDMFLKVADERTLLLGQYGPPDRLAPPLDLLQRQAQQALERNALLLRREWAAAAPGRRIVRIPMPDITLERSEAERPAGDGDAAKPGQEGAPAQGGPPAPTVTVVYRTYLNSLFVKGSHNVLIAPSYGAVDQKVESEVHATLGKVFSECHGKTEVVGLPSEPEIKSGGSVHCVAITVP